MTTAKRRARRIASDEATSWARNLDLGNPYAKSVLKSLGEYVDGDGLCWVGIPSLASDTDLSQDTVRRRLTWLEEIGAIGRTPQWIDEYGRRNGEGRGKRTTDLIRLLVDADTDLIEARAAGRNVAETQANSTPINPSSQQGVNSEEGDVSPRSGLGQPSQCGEGLISEPEPESSPLPPSRGSAAGASLEGWKDFEREWGEPILRQSLAQQEWARLSMEQRDLATRAVRGYVAWRKGQRKPPNVLGAHLFLRERDAWPGYAQRAPEAKAEVSTGFDAASAEGRAIVSMYAVARCRPFESRNRIVYRGDITPRVLAFADVSANPRAIWIEDRNQIGAWINFLKEHVQGSLGPVMDERGIGSEKRSGIWAPWPWPPRKDGTISAAEAGENE